MQKRTTDDLNNAIQNVDPVPHRAESIDGWELTSEQLDFMCVHHDQIEQAYEEDDNDFFENIMNSDDFRKCFDTMGWDEAYDRYEVWLETNT